MRVRNTLNIALKSLSLNKTRTFLTMLGIIIGVGSVVALTATGKGLEVYLTQQFESIGTNTLEVNPGRGLGAGFNVQSQLAAYENNPFTLEDIDELAQIEYIEAITPTNLHTDAVSFQNKSKNVNIIGSNEKFDEVLNITAAQGRFFDKTDNLKAEKVVVIGHAVAEELFANLNPIGKKMKLGSSTFKVIGVAEEKGGSFGIDAYVYIPIRTAFKVYDDEQVLEIDIKIKEKEQIPIAIEKIEQTLLKRLDEEDFSVIDHAEALATVNQILAVLTVGLGAIAAISLLVAGIGIMNIMLVSVTERTNEIGLRKALGATPNQILGQFLIEAALLAVIGGLLGLGLVYLVVLAIQSYFPATITLSSVGLAFGVSTLVGLIFGAAPARRAAKLSPIEALRQE